jgi:hypothetical protein
MCNKYFNGLENPRPSFKAGRVRSVFKEEKEAGDSQSKKGEILIVAACPDRLHFQRVCDP